MKLPRNVSGEDLVRFLKKFGYQPTRQTGSHIRLTRITESKELHLTIPAHNPLRIGTLHAILVQASLQTGIELEKLRQMLSGV
jgi:predicted RNA binding protein YcfA (HicA-like mRNA interferase family)